MKKYILAISLLVATLGITGQDRNVTLYNQGAIYVGGDVQATTPASLYIKGGYKSVGTATVGQAGKSVLTGDFINNVTAGNVFSTRTGSIEFRGNRAQYIHGTADKSMSFINFPQTMVINNLNSNPDSVAVVIDALMGATVKDIALTRGRLILDSKENGARQSDVAHLLVEVGSSINYNHTPATNYDQGLIQVNLAMGENYAQKRLAGFTPPFQKIYADYFMFNFLSQPTNAGLFGDNSMLITDPRTPMIAGTGYIVGLGIVPDGDSYYSEELDPQFVDASYNDRATTGLSFARSFAPASLMQFVTDADRFTGEALCIDDVAVTLKQGFNYVGNPFTVPLDMTGFVQETSAADDWGVTRAADGSGDVRNSFYVMSQGTGSYHPENDFARFTFNVSYLLGQAVGGTLSYEGGESSLQIAPMQMFIVGRDLSTSKTLTIPASARSHGNARFLRNSPPVVVDEMMIETRDSRGGGYDRLCVVFREGATTAPNDPYDAAKIFNESGGVNQIYTKSSDNRSMTTNVVAPTTENLVMYFQPANEVQEVTLGAYRLNSLSSVKQVVLEDTKMKVKTNLMETNSYSFTSSPSDAYDRFILHFSTRGGEGINEVEDMDDNIGIYYNAGLITIQGLNDRHIGSEVSIFSMNGQLVQKAYIDEVPTEQIQAYLLQGTYVVKITGEKITVTKKLLVR